MDKPFVVENAKERERLNSLVEHLTDEELCLPLGADWTIAVALAHLSFWDRRSLILLRKWKKSGVVEPSPIDVDVINDSLLSIWLAIPPRTAAHLAVSSAEEIDRELEEASTDLITKVESLGEKFRLYRSIHRKMHLDEIEEILSNKTKS
jgi:hypothetical protein